MEFGELAAERGMAVSVHAPYFAVLTIEDDEKRKTTLSSLEHTMKLGKALGAHTIVAHTGFVGERTPEELHELVAQGLERIEPKVRHLGVALGLETSGTDRAFGSLGDIALIAQKFAFRSPGDRLGTRPRRQRGSPRVQRGLPVRHHLPQGELPWLVDRPAARPVHRQ